MSAQLAPQCVDADSRVGCLQTWRELFCVSNAISAVGGLLSAIVSVRPPRNETAAGDSPSGAADFAGDTVASTAAAAAQRAMTELDVACIMGLPASVGLPLCAAIEPIVVELITATDHTSAAGEDPAVHVQHLISGLVRLLRN